MTPLVSGARRLCTAARATMLAPFTDPAASRKGPELVISRGEGCRVWDEDGKEYLDTLAGLWSNALGNGNDRLIQAATKQMKKLSYQHSFWNRTTDVALEYSDRLVGFARHLGMEKAFLSTGGSDANDTNVKLAWYYWSAMGQPGRRKVIAREKAYHGVTVGATSLTGLPTLHKGFEPMPMSQFVTHVEAPHYWRGALPGESERQFSARLADQLDATIEREGPGTIAAFIAEPVMGAGGVIPPPMGYFEEVVPVLQKHDILFIADEVITGFGRIEGHRFGSDHYNLKPDMITLAKALSSSYVPLGASLVGSRVSEVVCHHAHKLGQLGHGYTYGGHPVSCAVGLEALSIYEEGEVFANCRRLSPAFQRGVKALLASSPHIGEARGKGFMAAIEFVSDRETKQPMSGLEAPPGHILARICLRNGLLVRSLGDAVVLAPSLTFTEADLEETFEKLGRSLAEWQAEVES